MELLSHKWDSEANLPQFTVISFLSILVARLFLSFNSTPLCEFTFLNSPSHLVTATFNLISESLNQFHLAEHVSYYYICNIALIKNLILSYSL